MAELPTYFTDFLAEIRLSKDQVSELKTAHMTLRERLQADEGLSPILVSTFLQGSYRRSTIVRPAEGKRADVDIIVVTSLDRFTNSPEQALQRFRPFLERHYRGCYELQGRSIGIELKTVDLDLVVTSAPSEVGSKALGFESVVTMATLEESSDWRLNEFWLPPEKREWLGAQSRMLKAAREAEWQAEPLWIPDRDAKEWQPTHPLAQYRWTVGKNARTGGHFVNVVKAVKWWRRKHPRPEHPKGYPLERIVAECCPDEIGSVAKGLTRTLEQIVACFGDHVSRGTVPDLRDHGVDQNVLHRLTSEEFGRFHDQVAAAARQARRALDEQDAKRSTALWRELLGPEFPPPPEEDGGARGSGGPSGVGGYTPRTERSVPGSGRFA